MTEGQWWRLLRGKAPTNPTWLVFADWLEELGDIRCEMAREIHHKQLAPLKIQSYRGKMLNYDWRDQLAYNDPERSGCYIDRLLFRLLTGDRIPCCHFREYPTRQKAYQDLLNAYAKLKTEETIQVLDEETCKLRAPQ